ncbi:MAG TPA: hypothetical protein VK919_03280 [Solirubrobacterales bacterium]|nr:hypothetical protein [Solirubrobacterales bacterium]
MVFLAPAGQPFEAVIAERFSARLLGLAWLPAGTAPALLIPRCRSVHTFGMRFELDLCFLALPAGTTGGVAVVVDVRQRVRPRRFASVPQGAAGGGPIATLELCAGDAAALGIEPGASVGVELP